MDYIFIGLVLLIVFGYLVYVLINDVEKNNSDDKDSN